MVTGAQRKLAVVVVAGFTAAAALLGAPSTVARASGPDLAPVKLVTAKTGAARTSAREARRVDSVPAPRLRWYDCYAGYQCATAKLPLDYDKPKGAKVELALLRLRAHDRKHRIGSLFVNPGGPGASAVDFVRELAGQTFPSAVLRRFDIVGVDPRGVGSSQQLTCFPSTRQQTPVLDDLTAVAFPVTTAQERRAVRGSKALSRACSRTGRPLSGAMSTAEAARDLDVLRRSVGDHKLNYLGFSYGSYLGEVYANLFPDRFRALAIDGVLDPIAWAGTPATARQPSSDRIHSADGASKALHELLVRCDRAGGSMCTFAVGDPVANFAVLARRLRAHPVVYTDPDTGAEQRFGYADLIDAVLGSLYAPDGYADIDDNLTALWISTEPPAKRSAAQRVAALRRLAALQRRQHTPVAGRGSYGFPYDNSLEAFTGVLCTDSLNPARASSWPAAAAAADRRAPYFGRLEAWSSSPCASKTWTVKDEDAYRGPFTARTVAPVLVVGSLWDPATNYAGAVRVSKLLPHSRLLTSDNWGHTAYGTSDCATGAVDSYLLNLRLPRRGKKCVGDVQPFTDNGAGQSTPLQKFLQPVEHRE